MEGRSCPRHGVTGQQCVRPQAWPRLTPVPSAAPRAGPVPHPPPATLSRKRKRVTSVKQTGGRPGRETRLAAGGTWGTLRAGPGHGPLQLPTVNQTA